MALVVLALLPLVQVTLLNGSPWGAPDLVLAGVVWVALAHRPAQDLGWGAPPVPPGGFVAALAGFAAGLAADLTPPADHTVGRTALVLAVVGYLAGRWSAGRPALLVLAVGTLAGTLLQAGAAVALGDASWQEMFASLPHTLAWTVIGGSLVGAALLRIRSRRRVVYRRAVRRV